MARGGKRVGAGRRQGTTRQTIARNAIKAAANTAHLNQFAGDNKLKQFAGDKPRRPALEVLQTLLEQALELVEYFEPRKGNAHADRERHGFFFTLSKDLAKELAKYQAPQLRATR
jgi:hypothetical protein